MDIKKAGNSDRITREYLDSLLLEMRHIDGRKPDTTFKLYGETFATPIMMAALSHLNHIDGNGKGGCPCRCGKLGWDGRKGRA